MRLATAGLLLIAMACTSPDEEEITDTLTATGRDSALAASNLPGARGVEGAMRAADSANARAARLDSLANDP
jgi:hypothetical protein